MSFGIVVPFLNSDIHGHIGARHHRRRRHRRRRRGVSPRRAARRARVALVDEREPLTLTSAAARWVTATGGPAPTTRCADWSRAHRPLEEMADEEHERVPAVAPRLPVRHGERRQRRAAARDGARISAFGMGALRDTPMRVDVRAGAAEGYRDRPTARTCCWATRRARCFRTSPRRPRARCTCAAPVDERRRARRVDARRAVGATARRCARPRRSRSNGGRCARAACGSPAAAPSRATGSCSPRAPGCRARSGCSTSSFRCSRAHAKMTFRDPLGAVPRHAGFLIWDDPVDERPRACTCAPSTGRTATRRGSSGRIDTDVRDEPSWPPAFDQIRHRAFVVARH